jgi:GDP-4-dehydro-6-deoxy-D-mannose reductase
MKVLITGAGGFTGRKLVKEIAQDPAIEVFLCDRFQSPKKNWISCDLSIAENVDPMLDRIQPQQIYHLAGTFSNDFNLDFKSNVLTTKNILDALIRHERDCRVFLVGSAAEYGMVAKEDNPIPEGYPLKPVSIYGLTKMYQTHLMTYYHSNHDLDIVMARTFNLLGRGQSDKLFIGRIYQQIDLLKNGKINNIIMGNLNSKRDYISVNHAVSHYITIMKYGIPGEIYNVGSGQSIQIYELLIRILRKNGINLNVIETKQQTGIKKKGDVGIIYADISKLKHLGDRSQGA